MLCEKLSEILSELVVVYEKALNLAKQKNIFLTANDVNNLESLRKQEEEIVRKANKLESSRKALVQDLAKEYDLPWKGLTMAKLLDVLPEKETLLLRERALMLTKKVFELAETNESNAVLIKNAIAFVNYNINILTQASAEPTYAEVKGDSGTGAAANNSRIFDARC